MFRSFAEQSAAIPRPRPGAVWLNQRNDPVTHVNRLRRVLTSVNPAALPSLVLEMDRATFHDCQQPATDRPHAHATMRRSFRSIFFDVSGNCRGRVAAKWERMAM